MKRTRIYSLARVMLLIAFAVSVGAQFVGCSDSDQGVVKENQPPTVWLSSAPPEGSVEKYTIKMFWGGWDPDGEIAYYEYAVTDNEGGTFNPDDTTGSDKWSKVYSNDSTFAFTADVLVDTNTTDLATDFVRSHTFFIRAVDTEGLPSRSPAYRSFTAHTLSPEVKVSIPRRNQLTPASMPPISTYRWKATDYISDKLSKQDPDSVSWILEPLENHEDDWNKTIAYIQNLPLDSPDWNKRGGWVWYKAPEDSGKFWTTPPQDFGSYLFAIRAKDEAGAITPVFDETFNMRRVLVSERSTGPLLVVSNQYMGSVSTKVCNTALTILDLPAGIPVEFSWTAYAGDYGGTAAGYRYGWDIKDLDDPEQWEVDFSPFPPHTEDELATARSKSITYFFGTHVFTIEVQDNSGFCSRIEVKVNVVQFTMAKSLLLVDDFFEGSQGGWNNYIGRGVLPNDAEHDEFWEDALSRIDGFDAVRDVIEVNTGDVIPLAKFADYKSIIWSVLGDVDQKINYPVLHDLVLFRPKEATSAVGGKVQPNLVALFMAAGGHILICGNHPVSTATNKTTASVLKYPLMFKYELDARASGQDDPPDVDRPSGDESFQWFELCLEAMDFAKTDFNRYRGSGLVCPTFAFRTVEGGQVNHTLRAAMPLDPEFPRLELRIETAGLGKWHQPTDRGLNTEVYNPQYFLDLCDFMPSSSRGCFQPIYGLECFDTSEPIYEQPVAFWTSVFIDRKADVPGAVEARSAVFGFPPVMFKPGEKRGPVGLQGSRAAIEYILFEEWKLPEKSE